MPRATNNVAARKRRKKILKAAKGYKLGKSRLYKTAKDQVEKSLLYAYRDRRAKKRTFRKFSRRGLRDLATNKSAILRNLGRFICCQVPKLAKTVFSRMPHFLQSMTETGKAA